MAYNWLMMTSSAEVWIIIVTNKTKKKNKPKAEHDPRTPTAARLTRKNLVRNVMVWIAVVTARFKQSYR